jgi:TonB family protein
VVRALRGAAALVVLLCAARTAVAQPRAQTTPAPPPVVAPEARNAGNVPYPPDSTGDAVVVVELVIDDLGAVKEARIIEGSEPFAAATLAAASSWKFSPGRRGDLNVAARVRMRVEFHPPTVEAVDPSAETATAPSPTPGARRTVRSPPPETEVKVRGARSEAGQTTMGGGEVRQMPGAFGDAFRAIESLPGVVPIASGLPFFFVRGAPPGNTGYYLDGVRVPLLYHLAFGPSVVHPGLIDHVDFFPGGFPARYGRFAGGILSGETLGPAKELHGEGNLRIFDAGALVETPFADGRGTVLVAGRYSYPAAVLSLVAPKVSLSYWDYQARASWKLTSKETVTVFAFGSYDFLGEVKKKTDGSTSTNQIFATQFHRVDLRYDRAIGSTGGMRLALTLGTDTSGSDQGDATDKLVGLRFEAENKLSHEVRVRGGVDIMWDHYDVVDGHPSPGQPSPAQDPTSLYSPRNDVVAGAHADIVWRASSRVEVIPGLRADVFTSRRTGYPPPIPAALREAFAVAPPGGARAVPSIDPRVATRVVVTPKVSWISTFGVSHQPPSFVVPVPGIEIGGLDLGLQTSLQMSQGLEVHLPLEFTATPTVFLHQYIGLTDLTATCNNNGRSPTDTSIAVESCIGQRVRGRAYGAELLVRRPLTKRLTGWVSYTLSRSTRESHALLSNDAALQDVPSEFDRTHVLSVIGAYDLGRGWRSGARFFYYTGRPYSSSFNNIPVPPFNSQRLPGFYRIDVRLEKAWHVGKNGKIAFVIEGLNVTLNKEATDVKCTPVMNAGGIGGFAGGRVPVGPLDTCTVQEIGPVTIPSIGLEGSF